jgi:hypothetical protein
MRERAQDELKRLEDWDLADLRELRDDLDLLIQRKDGSQKRYSILDFRGIGHGTWDDVGGVDEFLRQERASWDDESESLKSGSTYEEILAQARLLSLEDEMRLLEALTTDVRQHIENQSQPEKTHRSVLEFEGMDQESWKDVDVGEYLKQERASWDDHKEETDAGKSNS